MNLRDTKPPTGSSLPDWLAWLETLSPKEIDLGLARVKTVMDRLLLQAPGHVLLVAGTNGKGSSVAMLDALLGAAGYRVGAYTSPHLLRYNERIAVAGVPVSDDQIVAAFERIEAVRDDLLLTYFEYGTLAALLVFSELDLDVWVLEIGLGGRLDACNAVEPTASLITNVSLDHCDWLGEDVETIAIEKAGVMRKGVPTVFGSRDVPRSLLQTAKDLSAELKLRGHDFDFEVHEDGHWSWSGQDTSLPRLPAPGLAGEFQLDNAAGVLALIEAAGLHKALQPELLSRVLPAVTLAGRLQLVNAGGAHWLLDVAHNPAGANVLAETLAALPDTGQTWAIVGVLDDKDVEGIARPLDAVVDHWIAVTADSPRAIPVDELARRIANACGRPCRIAESLADAMQYAQRNASENDRILLTGSFLVIGPALRNLELYSRPRS
ncbi:MAG: bifunctional tetrahydrofolate synthase/dihydrofolate synthase [Woeseiaceae bacterium]